MLLTAVPSEGGEDSRNLQASQGRPRPRRWRVFWLSGGLLVAGLAVVGLLSRVFSARLFPGPQVVPEVDIRLASDRVFTVFHLPITNTLLASWSASLVLVGFFLAARWRARLIPHGLQDFVMPVSLGA